MLSSVMSCAACSGVISSGGFMRFRVPLSADCARSVDGGSLRAAHMGTLMPRFTSQAFAGQDVQNPMIMPTCMSSQNAAEFGMS